LAKALWVSGTHQKHSQTPSISSASIPINAPFTAAAINIGPTSPRRARGFHAILPGWRGSTRSLPKVEV
jgi:hypothetical protein